MVNRSVKKIGYNLKYEHRWLKAKLGIEVQGWVWDGMIAAHLIDTRSGITSLKFQSLVLLGMADYDTDVKPYLKSDGANVKNKIREVELQTLLLYNGLDALLEYKVAKIQMNQLGIAQGVEVCYA